MNASKLSHFERTASREARRKSFQFFVNQLLAWAMVVMPLLCPPDFSYIPRFVKSAYATNPKAPRPSDDKGDDCKTCGEGGIPVCTDRPVMVYTGIVTEPVSDLSLPGSVLSWSHQRTYSSLLTTADGTPFLSPNGHRWKTDSVGPYLFRNGPTWSEEEVYNPMTSEWEYEMLDPGSLDFIRNGNTKVVFPGQLDGWPSSGGGYHLPDDPNYRASIASSGSGEDSVYTLTEHDAGSILIFYSFDPAIEPTSRGKLKELTNRELKSQGLSGIEYTYDGLTAQVSQITTADPQAWTIEYSYYTSGSEEERLQKIEVKNNSNVVIQKAEYVYYGNVTSPSTDLGSTGDLVEVKVSKLASDGSNWNVRTTQYRYYKSADADGKAHQLKMVLEADAIERILSAGDSGCDSLAELLTKADSYAVASGDTVAEYSSRSFTYYTSDLNTSTNITTIWGTENLGTKYGGGNVNEWDADAYGRVKTERVNGSCLSCGGSSGAAGVSHTYYNLTVAGSGPNGIVRMTIEDTFDSSNAPLYRKIWGTTGDNHVTRQTLILDPMAGTLTAWCKSNLLDNDKLVVQERSPSAHSLIDSNAELIKFFNPSASTNDADTVNASAGLITVFEYNGDGRRTGQRVKKGSSGTAYYVAATDYGDDTTYRKDQEIAQYAYPSRTTTRASGVDTTFTYTYWDGNKQQVKKKTTTGLDLSAQNGPDIQPVTEEYYDKLGRLRWTKDALGYVNYYSYQPITGGLAYTAIDVDPSSMPGSATGNDAKWVASTQDGDGNGTYDSSGIPTRGASHTALALVSTSEFDSQGRTVKRAETDGSLHYTVYEANRIIQFPYWTGSASLMPIQVTVMCDCGQVNETYSVVGNFGDIDINSSVPVGFDTEPDQDDYVSWTRNHYDPLTNKLSAVDQYHNIPSSGFGTLSTNFYRTMYRYDDRGRRTHVIQTVSGTSNSTGVEQVTQSVYDVLDRVIETKMGVSNASHDMGSGYTSFPTLYTISKVVYDGGGVGDSRVTKQLKYHGTGGNDYTGVILHPTYRGHNRGMEPIYYSGSETAAGPFTVIDIDWRGLPVATGQFISNPTWGTVLTGDGYTAYAGSTTTNRRALSESLYDDAGQMYRSLSYSIGTSDGSKGNYLVQDSFRDLLGRAVASGDLLGGIGQEMAYDGAGRMYQSRVVTQLKSSKFSSGIFQYRAPVPHPAFASMSGGDDLVISLSHSIFDSANNVIGQHELDVVHDDGTLGVDLSNHDDYIRSTTYSYYDPARRLTATANYGSGDTAGGAGEWKYTTVPTRVGSAPSTGNAVLVTSHAFEAGTGRQYSITSPSGRDTRRWFDDLGRTIWIAENYNDFDPTSLSTISDMSDSSFDRVANLQYDGIGNRLSLTTYNGASANPQKTTYLYENAVSARWITNTIYPDSGDSTSSGTDQIHVIYNLDGSILTYIDQLGTELDFYYDHLRRPMAQIADVLGGTTDASIRSITRGYDSLGRVKKITSHGDETSDPDDIDDVENQVAYTYDGAGKLINSEQSHQGVASSSPSVHYTYDASHLSSAFVNSNRLESVTYPNGRVLHTDYSGSDTISDRANTGFRLRETNSGGTILAEYSRTGSGQVVITDYPQPDLKQDQFQGTTQIYAALDRFGRTKDHRWYKYTSGTVDIARYVHTYDYDGNRLTTEDSVAAAATVHNDELYAFDGLNRLIEFDRGNLSMGSIASKNFGQNYTLDQLNNVASFGEDTDGNGTEDLTQARTYNDANEIATIASLSTHVAHDAAGNMTKVPLPGSWSSHYDLTWDAWNRLVKVELSNSIVAEYEYDGGNRRIVKLVYSGGSLDHTEHRYLSELNQVLEVRIDSNVNPAKQYTWGDRYVDDLVLRVTDTSGDGIIDETHYAIQDAGWNVTAVTNASGVVQERYFYDPYGKSIAIDDDFSPDSDGISDIDWEYRFTSRELDTEVGLHYFRARYYHDGIGRFIGRDSLEYPEGCNHFAAYFVPHSYDPTGFSSGSGFGFSSGGGVGATFLLGLQKETMYESCGDGMHLRVDSLTAYAEWGLGIMSELKVFRSVLSFRVQVATISVEIAGECRTPCFPCNAREEPSFDCCGGCVIVPVRLSVMPVPVGWFFLPMPTRWGIGAFGFEAAIDGYVQGDIRLCYYEGKGCNRQGLFATGCVSINLQASVGAWGYSQIVRGSQMWCIGGTP